MSHEYFPERSVVEEKIEKIYNTNRLTEKQNERCLSQILDFFFPEKSIGL